MGNAVLANRVALITGASRGIGYATARALLENDARIMLNARDPTRLDHARQGLAALGEVHAHAADVTDYGSWSALIEDTTTRFGQLDILINNAGLAWAGPFTTQSVESIAALVDVNIKGVLFGCRSALPVMIAQGSGTIVNVSSGAGHSGIPEIATYCASKFAVNGLTESLAQEVGAQGIRVYGVCPGRVATQMQREVSGRLQGMSPERVADAIVHLCGPRPPVAVGRCLDLS